MAPVLSKNSLENHQRDYSGPLTPWLQLANMTTPRTDEFQIAPTPPRTHSLQTQELQAERMIKQARDLLDTALGSNAKPTEKQCIEEIFDKFVGGSPVKPADLDHSKRDTEFEIHPPSAERDEEILAGRIRAGALRLEEPTAPQMGRTFIFAGDDFPAKKELYDVVLGLRGLLGRIVDRPDGPCRLRAPSPVLLDSICISDTGHIDTSETTLWSHFKIALHEIEAFRIRRCPICSAFFYAWRKDKHGCSDRCLKAWNQRQYRLNRERYERSRKWTSNKKRKKQNGKGV